MSPKFAWMTACISWCLILVLLRIILPFVILDVLFFFLNWDLSVMDRDSWFFTRWVPGLTMTICNKISAISSLLATEWYETEGEITSRKTFCFTIAIDWARFNKSNTLLPTWIASKQTKRQKSYEQYAWIKRQLFESSIHCERWTRKKS